MHSLHSAPDGSGLPPRYCGSAIAIFALSGLHGPCIVSGDPITPSCGNRIFPPVNAKKRQMEQEERLTEDLAAQGPRACGAKRLPCPVEPGYGGHLWQACVRQQYWAPYNARAESHAAGWAPPMADLERARGTLLGAHPEPGAQLRGRLSVDDLEALNTQLTA